MSIILILFCNINFLLQIKSVPDAIEYISVNRKAAMSG